MAGLLITVSDVALANAPLQSIRPIQKPADAKLRALKAVDDLVSEAKLGGKVSFAVADANTGEYLDIRGPLVPQPPASVAKAITTLYALDRLGADTQFSTQLVATGALNNGVLDGDLVLVGGGDPTLNADHLYELAAGAKEFGIREVKGQFKVWGGALPGAFEIDPKQPDYVGYNPAVSGLNLNFNRVFLEWERGSDGYDMTVDGRTEKLRPELGFVRARAADRRSPVFTYADRDGRDEWTVARTALGKKGGRWLPTRKPEIYAGDVMRTLARSHGIVLPRPVKASGPPQGETVAEHRSETLASICKGMLKFSTNLTAEVVGLSATAKENAGGLLSSAQDMSNWLKESYGLRKASFVDHSGLGDASRISAQEMVKALVSAGPSGALAQLLKPLAIRDDQNRIVDKSPITAVAKTGTLNFVSGLAGFVRTPDGRDLAFAIFASDIARRDALSEAQRERPKGARSWNGRAKKLQGQLINRWVVLADTKAES